MVKANLNRGWGDRANLHFTPVCGKWFKLLLYIVIPMLTDFLKCMQTIEKDNYSGRAYEYQG